ncbi:MAG TPA: hypothetical protein V6C58_02390 [Allocoleopsis sp.]
MTLSDIDLVEKVYNFEEKGYWGGQVYKGLIFIDIYLRKIYYDKLHSPKHMFLFIIYKGKDNINMMLYDATKRKKENRLIKIDNKKKNKEKIRRYINLYKDTDKRFTYFNLGVYPSKYYGHALDFLYDSKTHTIERYDSGIGMYSKYINPFIKNFFREIYGEDVKFIFDSKCEFFAIKQNECRYKKRFINYKSPGFCMLFNYWLVELRIKNDHLSRNDVLKKAKKIYNHTPDKICETIRGYAQFVEALVKKYKIIGHLGLGDDLYIKDIVTKSTPKKLNLVTPINPDLDTIKKQTPKNDPFFRSLLYRIAMILGIKII